MSGSNSNSGGDYRSGGYGQMSGDNFNLPGERSSLVNGGNGYNRDDDWSCSSQQGSKLVFAFTNECLVFFHYLDVYYYMQYLEKICLCNNTLFILELQVQNLQTKIGTAVGVTKMSIKVISPIQKISWTLRPVHLCLLRKYARKRKNLKKRRKGRVTGITNGVTMNYGKV